MGPTGPLHREGSPRGPDLRTDPTGSEPDQDPLTVENMAATVFHQLGIAPEKKLMAPGNRPIDIVRNGNVISELLA